MTETAVFIVLQWLAGPLVGVIFGILNGGMARELNASLRSILQPIWIGYGCGIVIVWLGSLLLTSLYQNTSLADALGVNNWLIPFTIQITSFMISFSLTTAFIKKNI